MTDENRAALREALRCAASALKDGGPPFALAGSYGLWAYGAPEPVHDVDFVVAEPDTEAAAETLAKADFIVDRPPEDWLFKARPIGAPDVTVDILHRVNGRPIDAADLTEAQQCDVLAIRMPVLPPSAILIQKLRALGEHDCDLAALLPATRAIREQLDWDRIEDDTCENPYAAAFLTLVARLGLREKA
ncbi:hypothetical protein [[Mycobacterium] wendilense]|uniref:Nucleotidyltransferase n=1 Tax=[Mycobacterium] wendilense TaxID=3064284 RepID=A0ABM9MJD9_9MYCO|nr:hypothetical protein [Mycolicibacterium sp. MU0050]CAJ1586676.1 hypothetical protein MU0050_004399 [Mycolicibacterium sp. MU0050]